MNSPASKVLLALIVVGVVTVLALASAKRPAELQYPVLQAPAATAAENLKGAPVGMSGCLAAACHGGPAEKALTTAPDQYAWQSSGSVWVAADPHTTAYSLLTPNPLRKPKVTAEQIMAKYAPGRKASDDARCLACHTNPALAEPGPTADPHVLSRRNEGVSCEACHGNAGGWVSSHTTWKGERATVYEQTGMAPLYDVGERAINCLGCHVGAPADAERKLPVRDMNHDMIAAGHPRLNFDFAEYLRRLPPHWQEKDRVANVARPLNAAKAWLVGRTAHAEAACKLLASRTERTATDPRTPWPEFAEYNCASCHHNLRAASDADPDAQWRKDPKFLHGRTIGSPQWQTIWPMTPAAALAAPARGESLLKGVLEQMEVPVAAPGAGATARTAAKALADRRKVVAALPDADSLAACRKLLAGADLAVPDWDSGSQLLFGLSALERSRGAPDAPPGFRTAFDAFQSPRVPLPTEEERRKDDRERWQRLSAALDAIRNVQKSRP